MKNLLQLLSVLCCFSVFSQNFTGNITDSETGNLLSGVEVTLLEDNLKMTTTNTGQFSFNALSAGDKTLYFNKEGYVFEDIYRQSPATNIQIKLRAKKISTATVRWNKYLESCTNYNNPGIPSDPIWNVTFKETALTGDLVANSLITRRDPSAVIKYNDKYYVWYSRKLTQTSTYFKTNNPDDNVFPWDYTDLYYATSTDGFDWKEEGPAVERGVAGSFDDRSVFTPEIFVHNDKFYLVYQVVKSPYVERVKNNVAMAVADSPDGPWKKLSEPILRPSHNGVWTAGSKSRFAADAKGDFDSHKVHDPCLMFYKDKFYLYYKGERMGEEKYCGEREIRWGVAIADNPEGPYVKSVYNPVTNTGHEVSVWNYNDGIAIIQKLDGPEKGSVQFASDGVNFEMMGTASGTSGRDKNEVPDALGIFRPESISTTDPKFGVSWGLSHHLEFSPASNGATGGWMYLRRFDLINKNVAPPIPDENTLIVEAETFEKTENPSGESPGGFDGVNATSTAINFVNAEDWVEYIVDFEKGGSYDLTYDIASPGGNTNIQLLIDGVEVASDAVPNTGGFEIFSNLKSGSKGINIAKGQHTIRVVANGTDLWQWNLDRFSFKLDETTLSINDPFNTDDTKISIYPNPAVNKITVQGVDDEVAYAIMDLKGAVLQEGNLKNNVGVNVENLPSSIYLLVIKDNLYSFKSTLFVKQ
ncbi:carbohydrate-binding protein [Aquimarina agarilytica]|uniref:carbohydrate-binding protein n=1 Tax=Aquimarina agarilytica TaxID=1087449 RepID=UPI000289F2EF|nr:carbohydrate-binding protein [Aquimarina agarilytica]